MATDSGTIRPVMKKLIAAGKVETEGQRRGMTYSPAYGLPWEAGDGRQRVA